MKAPNPFSTQSKVRSALQAAGRPLRVMEIRDMIGLSGDDGFARVNHALRDLMRAKEVEKYCWGRYQAAEGRPGGEFCKKQRAMQRVMWLRSKNSTPFTARKIAELAGCSLYLAQQYIAWLVEKGVLRRDGRELVAPTCYAPLYVGEDEYLQTDEWPVMRAVGKTQELDAIMNEMRERAQRFFSIEKLDEKEISNLKTAASRLGELVEECRKMKGSR